LQEASEEPFDINSVPKEVKSQPLAEKKAQSKKPTGLGAPPSGPASTVDAYERLLSSIPEFSNFGKLFKVLRHEYSSLYTPFLVTAKLFFLLVFGINCIYVQISPQQLWS
jgi:hypothetical protein